jgi:signal transduction histidine kinase
MTDPENYFTQTLYKLYTYTGGVDDPLQGRLNIWSWLLTEHTTGAVNFDKFVTLAQSLENGEQNEISFWRLQVSARDAILASEISHKAEQRICEVCKLLLGATTSSMILKSHEGWVIKAASGIGSEKLLGRILDMDSHSISGKVMKSGRPYFFSDIEEISITRNNDQSRYKDSSFCSFPLNGSDGEMLGILNVSGMSATHPLFHTEKAAMTGVLDAISTIITKIRNSEALDTARDDIKHMQEEETLREKLLYMAVHDLKNPLTLMTSNLAYLEELDLDNGIREIIKISHFGGGRILDMVKSILDSYRLKSGRLELETSEFDLGALGDKLANEFEVAAMTDGININVKSEGPTLQTGDEQMIKRVFANLLDNALKHSSMDSEVELAIWEKDDTNHFTVSDMGDGIPSADLPKIFDPFERAKNSKGAGYGIGLAFCQMAVERHGGEINVESVEGEGARFTVTLPKTPPSVD